VGVPSVTRDHRRPTIRGTQPMTAARALLEAATQPFDEPEYPETVEMTALDSLLRGVGLLAVDEAIANAGRDCFVEVHPVCPERSRRERVEVLAMTLDEPVLREVARP
jgi:hypothetical protein